jgi:hypothetical protein
MKRLSVFFAAAALLVFFSNILLAFQHHSEKALWIETKEDGKAKTNLAVTESIARMVIESDDAKVNFSKKGEKDWITKKMIREVLNGDEKSITVKDPDRDQEVTMYMSDLDVPGKEEGNSRLVLETYKAGKKTFSITLPDIEVESKGDNESDDLVTRSFGWKALLPFLAKSGGAMYIKDHKDDSEVWLYVE